MEYAVGYQHRSEGEPFSDLVLAHTSVKEVYFPWPDEPSGRPVLGYGEGDDPETVRDVLREELTTLHQAGLRLDLLLNANCYGAQATSTELEQHVLGILRTLADWGVPPEIVTTASPFIAATLKKSAPYAVDVRASVNMRLMTVQAMDYLRPWYDSFYLGRDVQRNLDTVRAARAWCDRNGKKLFLLANSGCLRNCPWQTFHDNLVAHSAAAEQVASVPGFNPHLCWTLYRGTDTLVRSSQQNFPEILKATWIRPEDVHRYEGLVDGMKLATRQHANPRVVMAAYDQGSFTGNLLDLFEPGFSPAFYPQILDNSAFPSDWFEKTSHCARECTRCGYCEEIFKQVTKSF